VQFQRGRGDKMKLSVFGLGYVGSVSAACLAKDGHHVIGVDVNPIKVETINRGKSPIIEMGIGEQISSALAAGRLRATTDPSEAVLNSDLSLVCVGTPSHPNGCLSVCYVQQVCEQIGAAIRSKRHHHTVVIRSTMLPGTIEAIVIPALEQASGKTAGRDFSVAVNPEFLREGTSLRDFYAPPFTLIGAEQDHVASRVAALYTAIKAPLFLTGIRTAEMVKYTCNCFHALKVSFANEIGNLCKSFDVDSHQVMEVFCQDTKLNLSPYYLKPGFAFGGSCLPKDLQALLYRARQADIEVPVLSAILPSNQLQIQRAVDMVLGTGRKQVGVLGLSFKAGTDDLRESPMVPLIECLLGKGLQVSVYDRDIAATRLVGANRDYFENVIAHISALLKESLADVLHHADVLVIANRAIDAREIEPKLQNGQIVIDLVRLFEGRGSDEYYRGICW
jgi:GDP-mannose 6-dehydrogenase